MSDWNFLNQHRIRTHPFYGTDPSDGFNGLFEFALPGEARGIRCMASDGMGWQHVSVSFGPTNQKTPSWEIMSRVKALFWEPEDWVVQFHPAESELVNNHPGCLHLWRCTDGREQPKPTPIMVGILHASKPQPVSQ